MFDLTDPSQLNHPAILSSTGNSAHSVLLSHPSLFSLQEAMVPFQFNQLEGWLCLRLLLAASASHRASTCSVSYDLDGAPVQLNQFSTPLETMRPERLRRSSRSTKEIVSSPIVAAEHTEDARGKAAASFLEPAEASGGGVGRRRRTAVMAQRGTTPSSGMAAGRLVDE